MGHQYLLISSEYSEPYSFYKLETVSKISNDNGTIYYTTPAYAANVDFYHYGMDFSYTTNYSPAVTPTTPYNFQHTEFNKYSQGITKDQYSIVTRAYPNGYDDVKGYAIEGEESENPVYYFASDITEPRPRPAP